MNVDIPNFLFENQYRAFPLKDSIDSFNKIGYDTILDIKGFSKYLTDTDIVLLGIIRLNNSDSVPNCPYPTLANEGYTSFIIQLRKKNGTQVSGVIVSVDFLNSDIDKEDWATLHNNSTINNNAGSPFAGVLMVIGTGIKSIGADTTWMPFDDCVIEDSCIIRLYDIVLDEIKIQPHNGLQAVYAIGNITFDNGYSTATYSGKNAIIITADKGAGLGRQINEDTTTKCNGILSINSVYPKQTTGEFYIEVGDGLHIQNDKSLHKITISLAEDDSLICPTSNNN